MKIRHAACVVALSTLPGVAAAQAAPTWTLVEEWRVGGEVGGGHAFDANRGFALLPNGGFVHLDGQGPQLHFLDPKGKVVRSVGRLGEGPGEFRRLKGMTVLPSGQVIVNDLTNGLLTFSADGRFLKAVRPTKLPYFPSGRIWRAIPQPDGRILDIMSLLPRENNGRAEVRLLWSGDFLRADTLPSAACGAAGAPPLPMAVYLDAKGQTLFAAPLLFAVPRDAVAYGADGYAWEAVPRHSNTIVRHKVTDCVATARVTLAGEPAALGAEERTIIRDVVEAEAKRWGVRVPDLSAIPARQAWYDNALTDSRGNLWLERSVASAPTDRTEVFGPNGRQLATIARHLPALARITATHVYGMESDADEVRYLVAYRIVKP